MQICQAASVMPDGLRDLEVEARSAGIRNVTFLIERWVDGTAHFDGPGESLLVALDETSSSCLGVGGLSRCPDVPGALRMRRFYVAERCRRQGVAQALAAQLISAGFRHTGVLTCNARASKAAPPFWEAMGFEPVAIEGITHRLTAPV